MMKRALSLFIILGMTAGCATFMGKGRPGPETRYSEAEKLFKEKKFSEAIASYKKIQQEYPDTEWGPKAKCAAAAALVSAENPQRDYALALLEFEEFLALYPGHERASDARSWRLIIKQFLDARKENDKIKQNIEQLKRLDIRQEEKRTRK